MGSGCSCCGPKIIKNNDVENAVNFPDLMIVLKRKYKNLENEKNEISEYLNDKSIALKYIEIDGLDDATLNKRLIYLPVLQKNYKSMIDIIMKYYEYIDLDETKEHVHNILYYHILNYAEDKEIEDKVNELQKYCNKMSEETPKE